MSNKKLGFLEPQSSKPDENSQGWLTDAHKNLPGFRELYRRFPKAEWYIMIDDDTYLFKHNLLHFLNGYDSSKL